jgi:hypothetical protein
MQSELARAWAQLGEMPIQVLRETNPRASMGAEEKEAMRILDLCRAGEEIPRAVIDWSLRVTGDAIGLR